MGAGLLHPPPYHQHPALSELLRLREEGQQLATVMWTGTVGDIVLCHLGPYTGALLEPLLSVHWTACSEFLDQMAILFVFQKLHVFHGDGTI